MYARKGSLTIEQINTLIELVKQNPCIWKADNDDYNDRNTTANAWTEIAKQIELPEELIRVKWKNLRDLFMREVKRVHGKDVDDYLGRWKHFKKLWFLHRSAAVEQAGCEDDSSEPVETIAEPYMVKIEPADIGDYILLDPMRELREQGNRKWLDNNLKNDPVDIHENLFLEQEPLDKRRRVETYTDEDCDMMFLKSLMPYFKVLKPFRKLVVRNKIQEMLLNEIAQGTVKENS